MQAGMLRPYEHSLLTREPLYLCHDEGAAVRLDVDRWLRPADDADTSVIERTSGPTLDVGCGPGRMLAALQAVQRPVLGIDISPIAVELARARGLPALHRSVFDPVPCEGGWSTVLLLDGTIGIGGDPAVLLRRIRTLVAPGGVVVVEVQRREMDSRAPVRFAHAAAPIGRHFRWALVGSAALRGYARATGFGIVRRWSSGGRRFVVVG